MTHINYFECDGCKKKMEDVCGYFFTLQDAHCAGCGGISKHFCTHECLKTWINKKGADPK